MRNQHTFLIRSQMANISGFESHLICCNYSTLPGQHENGPRQCIANWVWMCLNKTLFTQQIVAHIWPSGHSLLTPFLKHKGRSMPPLYLRATPGGLHDSSNSCVLGSSPCFLPTVLWAWSTLPLPPNEVIPGLLPKHHAWANQVS